MAGGEGWRRLDLCRVCYKKRRTSTKLRIEEAPVVRRGGVLQNPLQFSTKSSLIDPGPRLCRFFMAANQVNGWVFQALKLAEDQVEKNSTCDDGVKIRKGS